jgi:DNA-binding winged helix-turn-helix (wHTH) protein
MSVLAVESYRFGGFELDLQRTLLRTQAGEILRLRPKSFDMLRFFAANPGRVIGKQELINAVWPNVRVSEDGVFQCIRDIRTALGDEERRLIRSVPGRGYIFETEVALATSGADDAREEPDAIAAAATGIASPNEAPIDNETRQSSAAKQSLAKALQVNPKFTTRTAGFPRVRTDPRFQEEAAKNDKILIELGLPPE